MRTIPSTVTALSVTAVSAALALGLAGTASAESIGVKDPRDTFHGSDLRSVQVRHQDHQVVVVTEHDGLRRDPATGSGGTIYLDTDPADKGPEYVFVGGFFEGTDYAFLETEGFGSDRWGEPVQGTYNLRINYRRDRVVMRTARAAIGNPEQVRVAVRVSGTRTDGTSDGLVDWLGEPREFTRWVAQG